jgi:hypothetical protein
MLYSYVDSPVGRLLLAGSRHALKVVAFPRGRPRRTGSVRRSRSGA